jgi:hypothetical protein
MIPLAYLWRRSLLNCMNVVLIVCMNDVRTVCMRLMCAQMMCLLCAWMVCLLCAGDVRTQDRLPLREIRQWRGNVLINSCASFPPSFYMDPACLYFALSRNYWDPSKHPRSSHTLRSVYEDNTPSPLKIILSSQPHKNLADKCFSFEPSPQSMCTEAQLTTVTSISAPAVSLNLDYYGFLSLDLIKF